MRLLRIDLNNWNPRGELVKAIPNEMNVSVKKLSSAPVRVSRETDSQKSDLLYWGDAIGRIGYVDMQGRNKSYNNHVIIQTVGI